MKAKIKTQEGIYDIVIFAMFSKGWETEIVFFDEKDDEFKLFKYWSNSFLHGLKRNVFILEPDDKDWIDDKKLCGYNWFINSLQKLRNIQKVNLIDIETKERCKAMQKDLLVAENGQIKNKLDIERVLEVAQYFHDSYVEDILREKDKIIINLNTTWGCGIVFTIEGNPETNLEKDFGGCGEIFDSTMFFENEKIYWTNCPEINSSAEIQKDDVYFCANKVFWKLIIY